MGQISFLDRRLGILGYRVGFDNGVLRNVFRRGRATEDYFWSDVLRYNFFREKSPYFLVTPLMSVEALGLRLDSFEIYEKDSSFRGAVANIVDGFDMETCWEGMGQILRLYMERLRTLPSLSNEALHSAIDRQSRYQSPWSAGFFNDLFRGDIDLPSSVDRLVYCIAIDRLQAIPFETMNIPPEILRRIDSQFMTMTFQQFHSHDNVPCVRWFDKIFKRINKRKPSLLFNKNGEGLDTDIVHYVTCGQRDKAVAYRTCVFTNESLDSWLPRIVEYLSVISYLSELARSSGRTLFSNPGFLIEVDAVTLRLSGRYISVADDFDVSALDLQPVP